MRIGRSGVKSLRMSICFLWLYPLRAAFHELKLSKVLAGAENLAFRFVKKLVLTSRAFRQAII